MKLNITKKAARYIILENYIDEGEDLKIEINTSFVARHDFMEWIKQYEDCKDTFKIIKAVIAYELNENVAQFLIDNANTEDLSMIFAEIYSAKLNMTVEEFQTRLTLIEKDLKK